MKNINSKIKIAIVLFILNLCFPLSTFANNPNCVSSSNFSNTSIEETIKIVLSDRNLEEINSESDIYDGEGDLDIQDNIDNIIAHDNAAISDDLLNNFIVIPIRWLDGVIDKVFAVLIPIKVVNAYDIADIIKDVEDAIKSGNDNIKKNKDAYLEGLEASKTALEQQNQINQYIKNNPAFQQILNDHQETTKSLLEETQQAMRKGQQNPVESIDNDKELIKTFFERNPNELKSWLEKIKNSDLPEKIKESADRFLANINAGMPGMPTIDPMLAADIVIEALGTGAVSYFLCELLITAGGFVVGPGGAVAAFAAVHPFCSTLGAVGATVGGTKAGLENQYLMEKKGTSESNQAQGNTERKINPPKAESKVWQNLKPYKKDVKINGLSGKDKRYYKWDNLHNEIEMYDSNHKPIDALNPTTGERLFKNVKHHKHLEL